MQRIIKQSQFCFNTICIISIGMHNRLISIIIGDNCLLLKQRRLALPISDLLIEVRHCSQRKHSRLSLRATGLPCPIGSTVSCFQLSIKFNILIRRMYALVFLMIMTMQLIYNCLQSTVRHMCLVWFGLLLIIILYLVHFASVC